MKSAYATLGIPGNASAADIKQAFEQSKGFYSKEKLVSDPSLIERVKEIHEAYKILSTPDLRELHDRKLSGASITANARVAVPRAVAEEPRFSGVLKLMLIAIIVMFAIGTYFYKSREDARKLRFEQEIALKKQAQEAEAKEARERADAEAERIRLNAAADAKERQLRAESVIAGRQAQAAQMQAQAIHERQLQTERNAAAQAERQRQYEAQQRAGSDQRQLRNICMQTYGRPNC